MLPGLGALPQDQASDKLAHLSSAKSPQQMFGALLKEYVGPKLGMVPPKEGAHGLEGVREGAGLGIGVDTNPVGTGANDDAMVAAGAETGFATSAPMGKRIFNVSCMPCVAKKYEAAVEEMVRETEPDVDAVLTVRELGRLIRLMHLNVAALDETPFDDPMNEGSGAAVIFGATGGVMEAALRSAYFLVNGTQPRPRCLHRGTRPGRLEGEDLRPGRQRGTHRGGKWPGKCREALGGHRRRRGRVRLRRGHGVPGVGCAGGGGQPIHEAREMAGERGQTLYALDRTRPTRFSHENPNVTTCYEEFLGEPLSHLAHELLHTNQERWTL